MVAVFLETMRSFQRAFGRAAPDGAVMEVEGVVACVVPSLGTHSLFNAAVADDAGALRAVLPELEARYMAAGVTAWGVWGHDSNATVDAACEEYGMRLDSTPPAMARTLGASDEGFPPGVERTDDLAAFDAVETAAWKLPPGAIAAGLPNVLREYRCFLATDEHGAPAAVVGALHHERDCGIALVGTIPEARGRGLATAAMRAALADALRAGCRTTTLQSTKAGYGVYRRLGYRDHGQMHLWEKRAG